jgi:hypothetical protein
VGLTTHKYYIENEKLNELKARRKAEEITE